jgi:hypothetical protein
VAEYSAQIFFCGFRISIDYLMSVYFILFFFIISPFIAFNAFSQQGGSATGGNAQGGAAMSGSAPCYILCFYYGGSATGGSATGGYATGTGNANAPDTANQQQTKSSNDLIYANSIYGISITYPSDWKVENGSGIGYEPPTGSIKDIVTFLPVELESDSSSPVTATFSVDSKPKSNLNSILKDSISGYKRDFEDTKVISSDIRNTFAGLPSYRLSISTDDAGPKMILETGTLVGKSLYFIHYESDPDRYYRYLPAVQNMINSFKLSN